MVLQVALAVCALAAATLAIVAWRRRTSHAEAAIDSTDASGEAMPEVEMDQPELTALGGDTWALDVVLRNRRLIPTRTARAAEMGIGQPDVVVLIGDDIEILGSGVRTDRFRPEALDLVEHQPMRILLEQGIPSHGEVRLRWLVLGHGDLELRYRSEKARDLLRRARLE